MTSEANSSHSMLYIYSLVVNMEKDNLRNSENSYKKIFGGLGVLYMSVKRRWAECLVNAQEVGGYCCTCSCN